MAGGEANGVAGARRRSERTPVYGRPIGGAPCLEPLIQGFRRVLARIARENSQRPSPRTERCRPGLWRNTLSTTPVTVVRALRPRRCEPFCPRPGPDRSVRQLALDEVGGTTCGPSVRPHRLPDGPAIG